MSSPRMLRHVAWKGKISTRPTLNGHTHVLHVLQYHLDCLADSVGNAGVLEYWNNGSEKSSFRKVPFLHYSIIPFFRTVKAPCPPWAFPIPSSPEEDMDRLGRVNICSERAGFLAGHRIDLRDDLLGKNIAAK